MVSRFSCQGLLLGSYNAAQVGIGWTVMQSCGALRFYLDRSGPRCLHQSLLSFNGAEVYHKQQARNSAAVGSYDSRNELAWMAILRTNF